MTAAATLGRSHPQPILRGAAPSSQHAGQVRLEPKHRCPNEHNPIIEPAKVVSIVIAQHQPIRPRNAHHDYDTHWPDGLCRGLGPSCSLCAGNADVSRTPLRPGNGADPPGMRLGLAPRPLARPLGLLALGALRPELVTSLPRDSDALGVDSPQRAGLALHRRLRRGGLADRIRHGIPERCERRD
jgi:hypothetical protein